MTDVVYTTERLVVRRWQASDLPTLMAVYGDADAMRWVGDGAPITPDRCTTWMAITQANYARRGYGMFAVEWRERAGAIGFCGIVHPGDAVEAEVKYAYLRSHWGQGIATEALCGLIAYGAAAHGLRALIATTAPANAASHRVLEKAGMARAELRDNGDGTSTQLFRWQAAAPARPALRALTDAEYRAWLVTSVPAYAAEKVASGAWAEDTALERSQKEHAALLPQGCTTPGHHLYAIVDEAGSTVGQLWFAVEQRGRARIAYVYNIEVDRAHRRRGHARRALQALEVEVRALGLAGIALHVFGHNRAAQALYATLGYAPTNINLYKPIGGGGSGVR